MAVLMSVSEFIDTQFTARSRPNIKTVYKWCEEGSLPAERIGTSWYINVEELAARYRKKVARDITSIIEEARWG